MDTVKINENITLNYIPMQKLKTTSLGVYIHRPLNEDEASYNALLTMVLRHASKKYPSRKEITKRLEELYGATMGGTTIKFGEDNVIYFDAETISDRYTPENESLITELLDLLMSVIFEPKARCGAFSKDIVDQEKKEAIDRINALINDKRRYATVKTQQETARGTSFTVSSYGDKDTIAKITPKSLFEHYKRVVTSSVIDIYICGDTDINSAKAVIDKYVKSLEFVASEIPATEILTRDIKEINNVCEEMNVTQGKLSMGFLTNIDVKSKDSYALSVFNSVFGAGTHSKLFNNVREKLSLAYYASTTIEKYKGILIVNSGIEFENFEKAYNEFLVQLEEIRKGNISELEFSSSINTIVNGYNSYYDDQRAMATFTVAEKVGGTNRTIEEYIENIKKVTVEDVVRVANKIELDTVYFLKGKGDM